MMAVLPALVGVGVLCAPWVLAHALPAFAPSAAPLRVLAVAALVYAMATIPSYYLLAHGRAASLLPIPAIAVAAAAAAIFGTAAIAPHPVAIAWATSVGYAFFSLGMLRVAIPRLAAAGRRGWLWLSTLGPVVWAAFLLLALSRDGDAAAMGAAWRIGVFLALDLPVALLFGRLVRTRVEAARA
jgi:hypothetical protein